MPATHSDPEKLMWACGKHRHGVESQHLSLSGKPLCQLPRALGFIWKMGKKLP
jgi:hypothetical protein